MPDWEISKGTLSSGSIKPPHSEICIGCKVRIECREINRVFFEKVHGKDKKPVFVRSLVQLVVRSGTDMLCISGERK
jgi:LEA14-like dessication related protein